MPSNKSRSKPAKTLERLRFDAIGTQWTIDFLLPEGISVSEVESPVRARIDEFDTYYSRFREDSWITQLSQKAGIYRLPEDARPLFDFYRQLYRLTDGLFTPLIARTLADAGYDAAYSLQSRPLSAPPAWDDVLEYNFPQLRLRQPALLDFGAAGKGYLVDIIGALLLDLGVRSFCIDAGGDILSHNLDQGFTIGLEHPAKPGKIIGTLALPSQSLCGSAGNRRAWGDFHHVINPRTLQSPRHLAAVWVKAEDALIADGLATALFFVPASILATCYSFEYAVLYADFALEHSAGFGADFFTA